MKTAAVALLSTALATLVGAWTTPVSGPSGNPIAKPGLGEIVPVGKPYTITWQPTSTGTVTLLLLRGPSTNVIPLYAIAEKIDNSGTYSWTPSTSLESDTSRYGIQLIQDADGTYQWSTQFGISGGSGSSSSVSASPSISANGTSHHSSSPTATYNCTSCPGYNKTTTTLSLGTGTVSVSMTTSLRPTGGSNVTATARPTGASTTGPSLTAGGSSPNATASTTAAAANAGVRQMAVPLGTAAITVVGFFAAYFL